MLIQRMLHCEQVKHYLLFLLWQLSYICGLQKQSLFSNVVVDVCSKPFVLVRYESQRSRSTSKRSPEERMNKSRERTTKETKKGRRDLKWRVAVGKGRLRMGQTKRSRGDLSQPTHMTFWSYQLCNYFFLNIHIRYIFIKPR